MLIPVVVYLLMWLIIKALFLSDRAKGSPVILQLPDGSKLPLKPAAAAKAVVIDAGTVGTAAEDIAEN